MSVTTRSGIWLIAASIIAIATILALTSSRGDSLTVDEVPHIGAGYSYVTRLDYRLNPEHPPLVKDLAGLMLTPLRLNQAAFDAPSWATDVNGQWNFGRSLIFTTGNNADLIKNLARLPILALFVFVCWLTWKWSRERYGDTAALIAVVLAAFSPTMIAHARFVTTDLAAAAGVLAATYWYVKFLRAQSRRSFAFAALALGLAWLTKFNTILLGPFFILVGLFHGLDGRLKSRRAWRNAVRAAGLTALIGVASFLFVVWPVYIVQTWNYPPDRQLSDTRSILANPKNNPLKPIMIWAADKPILRAADQWMLGLVMVAQRSAGGNTIYWLGRVVTAGGPWYFPIVYFLKEPLAWWILAAIALTAVAFHHRRFRTAPRHGSWFARHTDEWVWLLWLVIYWTVSMRSTLNIGVRHLLPVYPFTIMLVAGRLSVLMEWLRAHDRRRWTIFSWSIAALIGWYVFDGTRVWPHYLTYFNQVAGGPSGGYRYVADSNLDWGQDLERLEVWMRKSNIRRISLDYFGWTDPNYYFKGDRAIRTSVGQWSDARDFMRRNQSDGWIAVSATFLSQAQYRTDRDNGGYRWLMNYDPAAVIGNSIFVWHIVK